MKKLNKKGFTLIELLAVIVILALLVAVAIPAVTKYLNTSRAGVFADNAAAAISAVRNDVISGGLTGFDEEGGAMTKYYKISYINTNLLEKKIKNSPYGGAFDLENSKVKVEYSNGEYKYYIFLTDGVNCIGKNSSGEIKYIEENDMNGKVNTDDDGTGINVGKTSLCAITTTTGGTTTGGTTTGGTTTGGTTTGGTTTGGTTTGGTTTGDN